MCLVRSWSDSDSHLLPGWDSTDVVKQRWCLLQRSLLHSLDKLHCLEILVFLRISVQGLQVSFLRGWIARKCLHDTCKLNAWLKVQFCSKIHSGNLIQKLGLGYKGLSYSWQILKLWFRACHWPELHGCFLVSKSHDQSIVTSPKWTEWTDSRPDPRHHGTQQAPTCECNDHELIRPGIAASLLQECEDKENNSASQGFHVQRQDPIFRWQTLLVLFVPCRKTANYWLYVLWLKNWDITRSLPWHKLMPSVHEKPPEGGSE